MKTANLRLASSNAAGARAVEAPLSVETRIERFLSGETDGHDVLQMLYGPVEDEPVPERFRALIRNGCKLRIVAG